MHIICGMNGYCTKGEKFRIVFASTRDARTANTPSSRNLTFLIVVCWRNVLLSQEYAECNAYLTHSSFFKNGILRVACLCVLVVRSYASNNPWLRLGKMGNNMHMNKLPLCGFRFLNIWISNLGICIRWNCAFSRSTVHSSNFVIVFVFIHSTKRWASGTVSKTPSVWLEHPLSSQPMVCHCAWMDSSIFSR